MEREIKILIGMILGRKDSYAPFELSAILNLKYIEGIYPYLRELQTKNFITKTSRGEYSLNQENPKIQDILLITNIVGKTAEILFTKHTKSVLEKFSNNPIIKKSKLPQNSLKLIKDIASNTKILHHIDHSYFIACWEETTKRILDFFDIPIKFDEEEFKHRVTKYYSSIPNVNIPSDDESQKQLRLLNMEAYLANKDYILDKLKDTDFSFLIVAKILTDKKKAEYSKNPFEITAKINEWKLKYIYNTDRIEGNPLSMQDVKTILTTGGILAEKDKKAVLETINSRTALDNIFDTTNELTIDFIKKLHIATQFGIDAEAGQYKKKENCITDNQNTLIDTTTPAQFVEQRMNLLIKWYNDNKNKLNPLVLASIVHNQFVFIHPFNDGNGRVARLLFNFILIKYSFFPIIFHNDDKQKYYSYLRYTKSGDIKQFITYCLELYRTQLEEF
jgi:antitoxin component HigA of HigAB toxin-antitoxin module